MAGYVGILGKATTSGGLWVPTDLGSGLGYWHSPRDTSKITHSSGLVSSVLDSGPNGFDFIQTGADTLKPLTGSDTINGENVLTYVSEYLECATANVLPPMTIGAVIKLNNIPANNARIIGDIGTALFVGCNNTGRPIIGGSNNVIASNPLDTNPHGMVFVVDGTSSFIYLDGVLVGSGNSGTVATPPTRIGGRTGTNAIWPGLIGDVVVANTALSGSDLTNLNDFVREWAGT